MSCQQQPLHAHEDSLDAARVLPHCRTAAFGRDTYQYKSVTGSTNDDARALVLAGAPHGALVVAEAQTDGRGRHSRSWMSPPGCGIYASLLLFPERPVSEAPLLGMAAAVAAVDALSAAVGVAARIKWPNDILLDGRKIAGILAETDLQTEGQYAVIIGLGMNVNTPGEALPVRPRFPAASLRLVSGRDFPRAPILAAWLDAMADRCRQWERGDTRALLADWLHAAYGFGEHIVVEQDGKRLEGIMSGVDADGALLLTDPTGHAIRIISGDLLPTASV